MEGIQPDSGLGIFHQPFLSWPSRCWDPLGMRMLHWCQVRVLQGVMMSGVALWTTDIGGYSGGDPKDPLFQVETKIPTISDHFGEHLKRSTISCNFTKVSQKTHNLSLLFAGADSPLVPVWCFLSTFPSAWGEGRSGGKINQNVTTSVQGGLLHLSVTRLFFS